MLYFLILFVGFSSGRKENIMVLPQLNSENFTKVKLNYPNWAVVGKYQSYADIGFVNNILETNCEMCEVEDWATGTSELVISAEERRNGKVFISAFTSGDSEYDIEVDVSSFSADEYREMCEGNSIYNGDICVCELGFTGFTCSLEVFFIYENYQNFKIQPYRWAFWYSDISAKTYLEFTMEAESNLFFYLIPQDNTSPMPFTNHSALSDSFNSEHSHYFSINCQKYHRNYMLWTFFCNQSVSCKFSLDLSQSSNSQNHNVIVIAILSVFGIVFCIGFLLICLKKWLNMQFERNLKRTRCDSRFQGEMDRIFPQISIRNNNELLNLCVICYSDMSLNEETRVLFCSHGFHKECIDHWVQVKQECPICKADIPLMKIISVLA